MRSFSLLALAAAALAPFVSAAPTIANTDVAVRAVGVDAAVAAAAAVGVEARGQKGCAEILVDLKVNLDVQVTELKCLTKANATVEVITPILGEIVEIIGGAVVDLQALVGAELSVILCSVDGTVEVTVAVIAQLLADVLCLVIGALGFVLTVVADVTILVDIIVKVALGDCLCSLIKAVLALVDGLLVCLIPLVLGLVDTILALSLNVVGELLTIL